MKHYVIDNEGKFQQINLSVKDIMKMQTPESKKTIALGIASAIIGIGSMIIPNSKVALKVGTAVCAIGIGVASAISNNKSQKSFYTDESMASINQIIKDAAARDGVQILEVK